MVGIRRRHRHGSRRLVVLRIRRRVVVALQRVHRISGNLSSRLLALLRSHGFGLGRRRHDVVLDRLRLRRAAFLRVRLLTVTLGCYLRLVGFGRRCSLRLAISLHLAVRVSLGDLGLGLGLGRVALGLHLLLAGPLARVDDAVRLHLAIGRSCERQCELVLLLRHRQLREWRRRRRRRQRRALLRLPHGERRRFGRLSLRLLVTVATTTRVRVHQDQLVLLVATRWRA